MYKERNDLPFLVLKKLVEQNLTLSVAESCTGGLFSKLITDLSGASAAFIGGIVAYNNSVKENLLQVSSQTLLTDGAVSSKCAAQMSLGLKKIMNADITVSFTGIAGPTSGTSEKSIGLVYSHIIFNNKHYPFKFNFQGDRESIREGAALRVFQELLKLLKEDEKRVNPLLNKEDIGFSYSNIE